MSPKPLRVLVIEDEPSIRENLVRLLTAEGFDATGAEDGETGLEQCRQSPPDLVVCDVMVPRLDGFAVLERVRADPALHALPFVFLTARSERVDLRRAMSLGADDYITKPYTRAEILDAIRCRLARVAALRGMDSPADIARHSMALELRTALDTGAFSLHYQPRVDLATGRVTGAEALLRWTHPEKGRISPADFIPVAEASGLMGELGGWVLRTACQEAARWPAAGLPGLRVSVNVSAVQLRDLELPATVRDAVEQSGLPSSNLELELTESTFVHDGGAAAARLAEIQQTGVAVALDDFGTGYSALGSLRDVRFDCIKVDRSFVGGLPEEKFADLVHSILDLAVRFKLRTVAEGIETPEVEEFLKSTDCDEGQGYFYAPPLPPDGFIQFAANSASARWPK